MAHEPAVAGRWCNRGGRGRLRDVRPARGLRDRHRPRQHHRLHQSVRRADARASPGLGARPGTSPSSCTPTTWSTAHCGRAGWWSTTMVRVCTPAIYRIASSTAAGCPIEINASLIPPDAETGEDASLMVILGRYSGDLGPPGPDHGAADRRRLADRRDRADPRSDRNHPNDHYAVFFAGDDGSPRSAGSLLAASSTTSASGGRRGIGRRPAAKKCSDLRRPAARVALVPGPPAWWSAGRCPCSIRCRTDRP